MFDTIHSALPEESPLSGPLRTVSSTNPTPARTPASQNHGPTSPPTEAFNNLNVHSSHTPLPPSYDDTPPPGPPPRAAAPPGKPVIAHARALYRYAGAEARDLVFEKDDAIAVHSYMNDDWWMGQNLRSGQEGIFPRNYVLVEQEHKGGPAPYPQQPTYGYPGGSQQQNPYNSNVPPMAIAEGNQGGQQGEGQSKMGEYGKKFGKKLGNATIFGAGATLGGNIVNGIF